MPRLAVLIAILITSAFAATAAPAALASPAGGQYSEPDPTSTGNDEPATTIEGGSPGGDGGGGDSGDGAAPSTAAGPTSTVPAGTDGESSSAAGVGGDSDKRSDGPNGGSEGHSGGQQPDQVEVAEDSAATQTTLASTSSRDDGAGGLGILLPILILLGIAAAIAFRIRDARNGSGA